ncbi:hypothetical protein ABPG74_007257 [Tetrahymena malaccensis]
MAWFAQIILLLIILLKKTFSVNFQQLNYDSRTKQKLIIGGYNTYSGASLFGQNGSLTFNKIYISAWLLPRFSGIPIQYYQQLSIYQGSIELLSLFIDNSSFVKLIVLGAPSIFSATGCIISENWVFMGLELFADGTNLTGSIYFQNKQSPPQQFSQSSPGINFNDLFKQQSLSLVIGNFENMQKYGCYEYIAFFDDLLFYWDSSANFMNRRTYSDDFTEQTTELIWNYDFFYTRANPNQYFNVAQSMNKYTNGFQSSSSILTLSAGQEFKTDYINPFQNKGLIISFHFKISALPPSSQSLILMKIVNQNINISIDSLGRLNFLGQSINGPFQGVWNQVVVVFKSVLFNDVFLFVSQNKKINTNYQALTISQLQFGDISNTIKIDFSHIRYYQGAYISQLQGSCFLQASQNIPTCLMCIDSNKINYKDNLSCSNNAAGPFNFIDWDESSFDCPKDMIYDQSGNCICMKQFFKTADGKCSKCPEYCDECTNQNTCVKQDPQRQADRTCPDQYFDDGYSCINISNRIAIQKKINLIGYFNQVQFLSFNNNQMQLPKDGPYSFFFSFTFSFDSSTSSGNFALIGDSNNEIFTFYYFQTTSESTILPKIQLFYQGANIYEAFISNIEAIWISFWTDMKQVILLSQSQSKFFFKSINLPSNIKLIDPQICVGQCQPSYLTSAAFRPLVFIQNMSNPINDILTLLQFLSSPVENIAKFEILMNSDLSKIYNNKYNKNTNLKLQYINTPQIDELKGFMFNQNSYATIQNINLQYWISFYCTILPVKIDQQVSLMSYEVDQLVEYFLVPQGQKILIRVCYFQKCIDTKYSMLNLNQSNNLFIFMRSRSPFCSQISFIEFEIVCNYKREQIQFLNPPQPMNINSINLYLGLQKNMTSDYLFYLNMINIDKGDGLYYFDYTKQEQCFIFSNIDQMLCIFYKKNLLAFQDNQQTTYINEQQCLSKSVENGYQTFINYQTRQCLLICADGYYKDINTKKCLKCLPQCKTCSSSRENCTSCNQPDEQQLPLCNCINSNFFLNEQNQCQKCSEKCTSCTQSESLCLECAANRVNPPKCECDPFQFQEKNNQCIQIVDTCETNCKKCKFDSSSNKNICYQCKNGRTNPPLCDCLPDYGSNQDGTCSQCSNSQFFDKLTQDCQPCSFPCESCKYSKNFCNNCASGLKLINNQCRCSQGLEPYQTSASTQNYSCLQKMIVSLTVELTNSAYYVIFTFDKDLKQFDLQNINNYIQLMLSEVSKSLYSFNNPEIAGNRLIVKLNVYKSIKATLGIALFQQTNAFVSNDEKYILSSSYLQQPIQFQVGPYIFEEKIFNKDLEYVVDKIKNSSNQDLLKFIKEMNFIFYLVNTVQPTNLFVLLKLNFPPNLYYFYQIVGLFIYPEMTDYMSTNYKQSFSIFGYHLNQTEVHLIDKFMYKRLGFSNSFLDVSLFGSNQAQSFNNLYISMWVLFRLSDYPPQPYNFLTINQDSTDLLTIKITPPIFRVDFTVLGQNFIAVISDVAVDNQWILMTVMLTADGTNIMGTLFFRNYSNPPKSTSCGTYGYIGYSSLLKQESLQLLIGNYSFMNKYGCLESLGFIDYLNIYWGLIADSQNIESSYSDDYTAQTTKLIWHFYFFYTRANPNRYFNVAQSMNQYTNGFESASTILTLNAGQVFETDYINSLESKGLIISFHFRISSLPPASQSIILMKISNSDISIKIDNFGKIILLGGQVIIPSVGNWNQIVLILKGAIQNKAYLFVTNTQYLTTAFQNLSIGQLQFGDPQNKMVIEYSHIRYYKGAQVSQNQGNCFLQQIQDQNSCIMCKDSYTINYRDNSSCSNYSGSLKYIDWNQNSPDCPKDMIYDQSANCICMKQFFKTADNKCSKCPEYCDECTDQNTCVKQDPSRKVDGTCPDQYFDDGYTCIDISQKLTISRKINLVGYFNQVQFLSFNNHQMQLPSTGPYSFFFSFTFQFGSSTTSGKFALVSDLSAEKFSFYYEATASMTSFSSIKVLYLGIPFYQAFININEQVVWISFWTNINQVYLLIQSNSQFFSYQRNISGFTNLIDPQICVGFCQPSYLSSPASRPFVFISNMKNPFNDELSLQTFLSSPVENIAKFEILMDSDLSQAYNNKYDKNTNLKLLYINIPQIDELKGFMFNQKSYATVLNIELQYWISFYCTILPERIDQQVSLLSYDVDLHFEYFLVPQGQKIFIRICAYNLCIDTKYSTLNLNKSNNLFILMRNKSPFSQTISFIEFEIVCNYKREQISFLNPKQPINISKLNLYIGLQKVTTSDYLFYLNMINIDKGDGLYYFDYTSQKDCFIFTNIDQMNCIFYKNNLLTFQDSKQIILINEKQCLSQSVEMGYETFVNLQTRQCLTRCADGYYKDIISKKCFKCFPQCKTCSGSRENCTSCKYPDLQKLPLCNCINPNFYLNEKNECQKCSDKCNSCTQNESLCLECSANRINPPNCECDPFRFQEKNNQCAQIDQCEASCKKCKFDLESNKTVCYQCKEGRTDPPLCDCLPGYKSNQDGTCSPCPSSQFFNKINQDCQSCSFPCENCQNSQTYCTTCAKGLKLNNNQCSCPNNQEAFQINENNQENSCRQRMNTNIMIQLKNSVYYVIFTFDHDLKQIDFKSVDLQNLIQLILSDVPKSLYSFNSPEIDENKLIIKLEVYQSIKATLGIAHFLQTNQFISSDEQYVLSSLYLKQPIQFQVGPYIFQESAFNKDLQQIVNKIKNSIQPTNLFMLLNLHFPPNLFMFYQILGSFIYPEIVDYMSNNYKQSFSLFGYDLNQTEVHLIDKFVKFGQQDTGITQQYVYQQQQYYHSTKIQLRQTIHKIIILLCFLINSLNDQKINTRKTP